MITEMFGSPRLARKIDVPPIPSSSLNTASSCSSTNARNSSAERVTSVGGVNCGNSAIASFSLWLRIASGSLKTRAPSRTACSSRYVENTYSMSNGGSLRISTAPKAATGSLRGSPASYHGAPLPVASVIRSGVTRAIVRPRASDSACCSQTNSSWPRAAASTIIA